MITLYGMCLKQKDYVIYLTSMTIEQLNQLSRESLLKADIWRKDMSEGYQRPADKERFAKIADYIEGRLKVEETIFSNSIILNLRQAKSVIFTEKDFGKKVSITDTITFGEIVIPDEAFPLYEVDGQHRIRGLIAAYEEVKKKDHQEFQLIKNYPIPVTIMDGFDRAAEAMQFVIINSTQKKVDPSLVLRILHKRWKEKGEQLDFFIKGQSWRLKAIEVCDTLNNDANSPWCERISPPGDKGRGGIITEKYFITTLEPIYMRRINEGEIKLQLPLYWRAISSLWKECMGENIKKYSLQRGVGAVVLHGIFPFIYSCASVLGAGNTKNFGLILKPIRKAFPPTYWARGGPAKNASSKGAQGDLIHDMLCCLLINGRGMISAKLDKIQRKYVKKAEKGKFKKILDSASKLIRLRSYHPFNQERVNLIDIGASGGYVLYSYNKQQLYVVRSDKADLKDRLMQHIQNKDEDFCLFNYKLCKDPAEAYKLECALYHLVPREILLNKEHPNKYEQIVCPFC